MTLVRLIIVEVLRPPAESLNDLRQKGRWGFQGLGWGEKFADCRGWIWIDT